MAKSSFLLTKVHWRMNAARPSGWLDLKAKWNYRRRARDCNGSSNAFEADDVMGLGERDVFVMWQVRREAPGGQHRICLVLSPGCLQPQRAALPAIIAQTCHVVQEWL